MPIALPYAAPSADDCHTTRDVYRRAACLAAIGIFDMMTINKCGKSSFRVERRPLEWPETLATPQC